MTVLLPLLYLMVSLNTANITVISDRYRQEFDNSPLEELLSPYQSTNNKSLQTVPASRPDKNEPSKIVIKANIEKKILTDNLKTAVVVISPKARKRLLLNDQAPSDGERVTTSQQFLDEEISSGFGKRTDPVNKREKFHTGIDISRPTGTEVFAWDDGVVARSGWLRGYGLTVDIVHPNGLKTRYAHLKLAKGRKGQKIRKGQVIGQVGETGRTTGANLHFEVVVAGKRADPLNHLSEDDEIVGHGPIAMNNG